MSGIIRRTVLVHQDKDKVLFHDWAMVTTLIGNMVEPRSVFGMRGFDGMTATGSRQDFSDDIARIDALETIDIHKEKIILSDDTNLALHGGQMWQRLGF